MAKSFDVSYRFLAIDAFTAVGDKVNASVDKIKTSIQDVQKATNSSGKSFARMADSIGQFGTKLKSFGSTVSTHVSLPIAAMGVAMIRLADIQAQAEAKLITGLDNYLGAAKFTFDSLLKMAGDLQNKSLFGDEEIIAKVTVPLLRFQEIGEDQFVRAQQAIIDIAAGTGRGLQAIGIQVARALNEPLRALTTLERLGIDFNIANLKETLEKLTESGRHLDAQTVVLDVIQKQFKGSAEALTKIGSGPLKQLWMRLGDISEKIGDEILEILGPFIEKLKELATKFESLTKGQRKFIALVIVVGAVLGPVLVALGTLAIVIKVAALSFAVLNVALAPVLIPLGLIALALFAGYKAGQFAAKFFKENFPNALATMGEKVEWLKDKLVAFKEAIIDFFSLGNIGGKFIGQVTSMFGAIGEFGLSKTKSFDAMFEGDKMASQAAHAFETQFNFGALERDSADVNINLRAPENVVESVSAKATGRMIPKVGMQMIDG